MLPKLLSILFPLLVAAPLTSAHGINSDADRDHTGLSWAEIHMLGITILSLPSSLPKLCQH